MYQCRVGNLIAKNIKAIRLRLNLSQQEFARRVGKAQATVSRWENGIDDPDDDDLKVIGRMAGIAPAKIRYGIDITGPTEINVVGYIGAGEAVYPIDDHAQGAGLDKVPVPPDVDPEGLVAVRIKGTSMRPLRDGWHVYYKRDQDGVPEDCIGQLCVVQCADGRQYIKELRRGYEAGTYNLQSWSAGEETLENQQLKWAAKVLAILPA